MKTHHFLNSVRNLYSKLSLEDKKIQCGPEAAYLLIVCISLRQIQYTLPTNIVTSRFMLLLLPFIFTGYSARVILIFANHENKRNKKLYHLSLHSFCSSVSKIVFVFEFCPILGMWALFLKNRHSKGTTLQR